MSHQEYHDALLRLREAGETLKMHSPDDPNRPHGLGFANLKRSYTLPGMYSDYLQHTTWTPRPQELKGLESNVPDSHRQDGSTHNAQQAGNIVKNTKPNPHAQEFFSKGQNELPSVAGESGNTLSQKNTLMPFWARSDVSISHRWLADKKQTRSSQANGPWIY